MKVKYFLVDNLSSSVKVTPVDQCLGVPREPGPFFLLENK